MKAVTYQGKDKPLLIEDIAIPDPGPGQLLLKIGACGICGSDLHACLASLPSNGIDRAVTRLNCAYVSVIHQIFYRTNF